MPRAHYPFVASDMVECAVTASKMQKCAQIHLLPPRKKQMKVLQSIRSRKLTVLLLIPDARLLPQPARCKCFNLT
jgi:hypothetical protein